MNLPKDFMHRMQKLLGDESKDFFASYQTQKAYGLRMNPLKYSSHISSKDLPFTLTPVAWAKEGFYAISEEHPGKHPLHEGGAYYIQEPSAMSVVSLLNPQPGDLVCDLCAAPGGKSTQIAGRLAGEGLLVANEIFPNRAKILSQNIERLGIGNCVVCNEPPDKMAAHFPTFFDKIVVDAPCSGEGMFRKDETAIQEWSLEQVEVCATRQKMILEYADQMLAPNGIMVYSTCTFAPEEDENMIIWFLATHPDYILEDWREILPDNCGLEGGRIDFLTNITEIKNGSNTKSDKESSTIINSHISQQLENTLRLWPHKLCGEGHFVARLRKSGVIPDFNDRRQKKKSKKVPKDIADYREFVKQFLRTPLASDSYTITKLLAHGTKYQYFKDELYLIPEQMNSLQGLKVVRAGLHLGTRKKNRFEPSHALAKALAPYDTIQYHDCDFATALCYLKGETIPCDTSFKSWTLVCYQGISLGWGKAQNGVLKNHYPKGLRIMSSE